MITFNQKIIKEINEQVSTGQSVVIKLKESPEKEKPADKEKIIKTVDTVTSASFETKMHFAQSQVIAANTLSKEKKKKRQ